MTDVATETVGHAAALACAATWAVATIIFGRAATTIDVRTLNLVKCVFAAMLLGATSLIVGDIPSIHARDAVALGVSAFFGIVVADTAYFVALRELGPARGVLFVSLVPVCTALLAVPVLHEPFTLRMLAGMVLTLGGVTFVVRGRAAGIQGHGRMGMGVLGGVLYCVAQGGANVLTKGTDLSLSPLALSTTRMGLGAVFLLGWVLVTTRGRPAVQGVREKAPQVALASFLGTYVGLILGTFALRTVSAGVATTLVATTPLFALAFSLLLGERPPLRSVAGAVVALAGVALLVL